MAFEKFAEVKRKPAFRDAARDAGLNETELKKRVRDEANGTATWAKWPTQPSNIRGDLNLLVDSASAISSAFVLS